MSCVHYPDEPAPGNDRSNPRIQQIGYSTVRITDDGEVSRAQKDVISIGFGIVSGNAFTEQYRREPAWIPYEGSWLLSFEETISIPGDVLYTTVRIRKYRTAGGWMDEDHVIPTNRYPYQENAVVCAKSIFGEWQEEFQVIAVAGGSLFAVNMGPTRLWKLDPGTNTSTEMYTFGAGDNLAGSGEYLFVDVGHARIERWNARTLAYESTIRDFNFFGTRRDIRGLSADESIVYALINGIAADQFYLLRMTYDGSSIDSVDMPIASSDLYMSVAEGIVYTVGYDRSGGDIIHRYDLRTQQALPPVLAPALDTEGIEIVGQDLYYVDYSRGIVGKVHLDDLIIAQEPVLEQPGSSVPAARLSARHDQE